MIQAGGDIKDELPSLVSYKAEVGAWKRLVLH